MVVIDLGSRQEFVALHPATWRRVSVRDVNCRHQHHDHPAARWTQYDKVLLEPVTFWGGDGVKISAADQQMLTNFLHQALSEQLGKKFGLVDRPGPGVMRGPGSAHSREAATPGLRTISVAVPQARLLNTFKYAATGTYAFVGGAQAEARLTDAVTGQLLGAWVDKRAGGGSIKTAAQVEWAASAADTLYSWTSGAAKPS